MPGSLRYRRLDQALTAKPLKIKARILGLEGIFHDKLWLQKASTLADAAPSEDKGLVARS